DYRKGTKRGVAVRVVPWLVALGLSSPSWAGVADSPLPSLNPPLVARKVFIVPGVIKSGHVETEFTCTSLEAAKTFSFAVEVFGPNGGAPLNDATTGNGVATLIPGATRTVATGTSDGLHEDVIITFGATRPDNGSARIVSESLNITCTAFAVDKRGQKRCLSIA